MPYSYAKYKTEYKDHMIESFEGLKILDAGAGSGMYSDLLLDKFPIMDALEIFPNYIEMFKLKEKYNNVFIGDILSFDLSSYDYIILGDIIEHLKYEQAYLFLNNITELGKKCMVAVPYMFEQGEEFGNVYETHHQPDLTKERMFERYPMLNFLFGDENYGYYINY
jgi:2-polyprenyl-3-methyl-5-hydroxy-6-metoxy-1,4-benzoquinol methylase